MIARLGGHLGRKGDESLQRDPECLNEEPDVGKLLVGFCEGLGYNWCMAEILWHLRETRRITENTNISATSIS